MEFKNFIERNLTTEIAVEIKAALVNLETSAKTVVVDLNGKQRQKYGSVHEENKKLINKVKDIWDSKPSLFEGNEEKLGLNEFGQNHENRKHLEDVIRDLESLKLGFQNAKILYDKSNYDTALDVYKFITLMHDLNIPGYEHYYKQLSQFFAKKSGENNNNEAEDSNENIPPADEEK